MHDLSEYARMPAGREMKVSLFFIYPAFFWCQLWMFWPRWHIKWLHHPPPPKLLDNGTQGLIFLHLHYELHVQCHSLHVNGIYCQQHLSKDAAKHIDLAVSHRQKTFFFVFLTMALLTFPLFNLSDIILLTETKLKDPFINEDNLLSDNRNI